MNQPENLFTLPAAWELVRDAIQWLHNLFGEPKHVLHCGTLKKKDHTLLISWLRSLEALVSCLLFAAAAEVKLEDKPRKPRTLKIRQRKFGVWRIRFRLHGLPQSKTPSLRRARRQTTATLFPSTHGPAARYEVLRRVAENPIAYAVRLARRLKRDAELPRRIAKAKLHPYDPFAPNAEAAQRFLRQTFPTLCDSSWPPIPGFRAAKVRGPFASTGRVDRPWTEASLHPGRVGVRRRA